MPNAQRVQQNCETGSVLHHVEGLEMWSWWISGSASYVGQDGVVRIRAETVWWCVGPVSGEWMLCGLRSADMVDVGQVIDMVVSLPPSHTATHKVAPRPPQLEHLNVLHLHP